MSYSFDTLVPREEFGSLKRITCPGHILAAGLPSYDGAEMEFAAAPCVMQAVARRAAAGLPGYTLCDAPYRRAVQWWMRTQRGVALEEEWIVPTHGTIFSLATVIRMATRPGECIIVQPPVYNRYEQAATRLGRRTLHNRLVLKNGRYEMDFAGLERLMALPESRVFVLCNPHNPTGNVWREKDLARISELANRHGVLVYSDEIFSEISFGGTCPCYLDAPGAHAHAVVCTSLGKTFNYTGVNHANILIADTALAAQFTKQRDADHYGSIDPWAYSSVLAAYTPQGAQWKDAMVAYVKENIDVMRAFFEQWLPRVTVHPCEGTFVLWIDWSGLGLPEAELHNFLENEALLHLSPGGDYSSGAPCLTRMSIAVPRSALERSLALLRQAAAARGFAAA